MKTITGHFRTGILVDASIGSTFTTPDVSALFLGSLYLSDLSENPCTNPAKRITELYAKEGNSCFRRLDGTFLLILKTEGEMIFMRDRFGSGPQLYYDRESFSSELAGLIALQDKAPEADWDNLAGFLQFGYIPSPATGIRGINKLPGGTLLTWNGSSPETRELYSAADYHLAGQTTPLSREEAVEQYKFHHQQAIRKRIAGAANPGVLLSGGYDSAGNISALREIYNGKVQAFSIGFKNNPWSEIPQAKQMADKIGATFHQYEIDGSEIRDIPELVRQLGDPFQEGGLMVNFTAMKLVSQFNPDIVLGGDGNDQHFGTSAKELAINHVIRNSGARFVQKTINSFEDGKANPKDGREFRYAFQNRKILNILCADEFGFLSGELKSLGLKKPSASRYGLPAGVRQSGNFEEFFFQRQYHVDVRQVIQEVILFKAGQNAALRNINLAFPYMDQDMAGFLATLPRDYRFTGSVKDLIRGRGKSKVIHRLSYSASMPKELSTKKKQGGFAPLPLFFQSQENLDLVERVILNSGMCESGIDKNRVAGFIREYRAENLRPANWFWYTQVKAFRLFNLLILAVWWEIHIKGRKGTKLEEFA